MSNQRGSIGIELVWILVALASVIAAGILGLTFLGANGAPQQAAGAAVALGVVIIPYCFARALTEIVRSNKEQP